MTQEQVALELGVSHKTIDLWEANDISNCKTTKANIPPPDWRVKLAPEVREELVDRHHGGASQKHREDQQQEHNEVKEEDEDNRHSLCVCPPAPRWHHPLGRRMRDEESHTLPATLPKVRSSLKQSRAFVLLRVAGRV